MSEECQVHHKKLPCEECKAEEQKKIELYDSCTGCSSGSVYCDGDCDTCSFSEEYNCLDGAYFEEDEE